jgi:carboxylate-amine ligase
LARAEKQALIPPNAFEGDIREGTLGAEEELWLADPTTMKLANGAHKILAEAEEGHFTGELIDSEIESNTGVHADPEGVSGDLPSRRVELLERSERLGRVLGASGTQPLGDWREQEIIDLPQYRRLEGQMGWLIRRNNTFSLHVHYAVRGRGKAVYLFDRLREYVPHMLALSANSPFWQGEYTDMRSARVIMFSRAYHRAGLPEPLGSWDAYANYVDFLERSGSIVRLGEIWWDVRLHPGLSTVELRAFDAQTAVWRSEALVAFAAALCDALCAEYDAVESYPLPPGREIEENKWSVQRNGLDGHFIDHRTYERVPTREVIGGWLESLKARTRRDLSRVERILVEPTEADRQLEVWRETGSVFEVARDVAARTRASVEAG